MLSSSADWTFLGPVVLRTDSTGWEFLETRGCVMVEGTALNTLLDVQVVCPPCSLVGDLDGLLEEKRISELGRHSNHCFTSSDSQCPQAAWVLLERFQILVPRL